MTLQEQLDAINDDMRHEIARHNAAMGRMMDWRAKLAVDCPHTRANQHAADRWSCLNCGCNFYGVIPHARRQSQP